MSKIKSLNIPKWFPNKPDIWSNQLHRPKLKHIEDFVLGLGFKLESAHVAISPKSGLFSIFFNIPAYVNRSGCYDCIRTYVFLLHDEKEITWNIQIPTQGKSETLAEGTDKIKAEKYKAELLRVLNQYKVEKYSGQAEVAKNGESRNMPVTRPEQPEQMALF